MTRAWGIALLFVATPAFADEVEPPRPRTRLIVEAVGGARELLVQRIQRVADNPQAREPTYHDEVHPLSTGIPIYGGGVAVGAGLRPVHGHGGAVMAHYEMGTTNYALRSHVLFLGGEWHYVVGVLSPIVGARLGYLAIERATDGPLIAHWGIGLNAGLSVDVVSWDGGVLFVRPELDAMLIPHAIIETRSLLWGGLAGVGIRL
jgi:hypothetical protein